jgi:hypothetical protein
MSTHGADEGPRALPKRIQAGTSGNCFPEGIYTKCRRFSATGNAKLIIDLLGEPRALDQANAIAFESRRRLPNARWIVTDDRRYNETNSYPFR